MKTLVIILIVIVIQAIIYLYVSQNNLSKFKDVGPFRQYYLDPLVNHPLYASNSIYSMPGSIGDPYILYGSGYMPFEGNVPAVDVMRANNKQVSPSYYKQYIQQNITPYSEIGL